MTRVTLQTVTAAEALERSERERRTQGILSQQLLRRQNLAYAGTAGVSRNNRDAGFSPAYYDSRSGEAVLSRFANGQPAPVHLLEGLPKTWILRRNKQGQVIKARPGVVAGFMREGVFYTREQATQAISD